MSSTITTSGFDSYKLQTTILDENTVSHTGPELGHAVDIPPMALKRTWTREKELGIGSFGEVWCSGTEISAGSGVAFGDGAEAAGNVTRVRDRRKGERRGKLVRRVIVRLGARESVEQ